MAKTDDLVAAEESAGTLAVAYRGLLAGRLSAAPDGLSFAYASRWLATKSAIPLSLTMPLRAEPYPDAVITPWIQNLLPEAEPRDALARVLGVSVGDAFGLLRGAGADTAGAFSFSVPDATPVASGYEPVADYIARVDGPAADDDAAVGRLLDQLARKPFFADDAEVRVSLAGGQVKTTLAAIDVEGRPTLALARPGLRYAVPHGEAASTLIVKPDNPQLLGIVEIEAYCLELARRIGLPVTDWCILRFADRLAFVAARYDRRLAQGGDGPVVRRIHQEDFCQLLGLPPSRKYETAQGGGPSLADLFAAARAYLPPADVLRFRDYVIFNILVGNTDAHAKNYSVLVLGDDRAELAPLYDVNSVLAWRGVVNQRHAQKIADRTRLPVDTARRHWEAIAAESGLSPRETIRRVDELATAIVIQGAAAGETVKAEPGATAAIVDDIAERIDTHARRIQGRL